MTTKGRRGWRWRRWSVRRLNYDHRFSHILLDPLAPMHAPSFTLTVKYLIFMSVGKTKSLHWLSVSGPDLDCNGAHLQVTRAVLSICPDLLYGQPHVAAPGGRSVNDAALARRGCFFWSTALTLNEKHAITHIHAWVRASAVHKVLRENKK